MAPTPSRRTASWAAGKGYNQKRGEKVITFARDLLDLAAPLEEISWADIDGLSVEDGRLSLPLKNPAEFKGYVGDAKAPSAILLGHNGLHIEVHVDKTHPDRQDRQGRHQRCGAGIGHHHHHGL
jgi:malate synthase